MYVQKDFLHRTFPSSLGVNKSCHTSLPFFFFLFLFFCILPQRFVTHVSGRLSKVQLAFLFLVLQTFSRTTRREKKLNYVLSSETQVISTTMPTHLAHPPPIKPHKHMTMQTVFSLFFSRRVRERFFIRWTRMKDEGSIRRLFLLLNLRVTPRWCKDHHEKGIFFLKKKI